jgi:DNA polymerase-1
MNSKHTLVLVDGSSYLYRAYHALPPLNNSAGEPTGAVYGVASMLRRLRTDHAPQFAAVVFDARGKTFRDEIFKEYKANRPAMPDDLARQFEPLREIVCALGFPLLQVADVEADDVIGTLAIRARACGMTTKIYTSDKDMAQIVNGDITLINTMSNTVLDRAGVEKKFGVTPEQIVDYLALVGDSSDNIPGVPKVGPKTAAKWLGQYHTLDAIIANAGEIRGKIGENLRANLEQLDLSRRLATLDCNVELERAPEDLALAPPDTERLRATCERLEFTSWLKQLDAETGAASAVEPTEVKYETVLDEKAFERWLERLEQAELIAFDTETTSLRYMEAEIVGVSFAVEPGYSAYVPVAHCYEGAPAQLDRSYVLEVLRPMLENPDKPKLGQHLKYDAHVLANHGIALSGMRYDTMLESYVLNSVASRHDMDSLAEKYLATKTVRYEDVAGKGARQKRFDEIPIETAAPYAAEDADITLRLHRTLWPKLAEHKALKAVFEEIEMPLAPVLLAMERTGVLIDTDMLAHQSEELAKQLADLDEQACEAAGRVFNLGSPKQLQTILFEDHGLPVIRKTSKGQPSTAEDVLQELAAEYALPRIILEHRALAKLKSTYTDRLASEVNPATGRVHTSYHQAVTATGRLSSSEPNLQNIPVRTSAGRRIRQAFIAPPGRRILAADYSQIELRIMAHLSGDQGLLDAFAAGEDIHRATAAEVFGLAP